MTTTTPTARPARADEMLTAYRGKPLTGIVEREVEMIDGFIATAWFAAEDVANWRGDEFRYGVLVKPDADTGKVVGFWFETGYWLLVE